MQKYPEIVVTIGGVGGSGTRVIAGLVNDLGYFIGSRLNESNDNTALAEFFPAFRARILTRDPQRHTFIRQKLRDFAEHMRQDLARQPQPYSGWGWKLPANFMVLKDIAALFPHAKYVHTVRHGLDMAYSNNHQQLLNWGTLVDGFTLKNQKSVTPQNLLRYWIQANNRAVESGRTLLGEKFLVIRLEDLCRYPEAQRRRPCGSTCTSRSATASFGTRSGFRSRCRPGRARVSTAADRRFGKSPPASAVTEAPRAHRCW